MTSQYSACGGQVRKEGVLQYSVHSPHSVACLQTTPEAKTARINRRINAEAKKQVLEQPRVPCKKIVQALLLAEVEQNPLVPLPKPDRLVWNAQRAAASKRPKHPKSLGEELKVRHSMYFIFNCRRTMHDLTRFVSLEEFLPVDFLLSDVKRGDPVNFRTLIFAKKEQLRLLHRALLWTCDGTHELVQTPYNQLSTIQAFIRSHGNIRLVPFVFAVMTNHTTVAYREVFEAVISSFPSEWDLPK